MSSNKYTQYFGSASSSAPTSTTRSTYTGLPALQATMGRAVVGRNAGARPTWSKNKSDFAETIVSKGVRRRYAVHIPPSYSSARPAPLVFVFHGAHLTGRAMEGLTGFDQVADRNGFLVVYPDGIGHKWNDGPHNENGVDDVQFVADLIARLSQCFSIDSRRIYACGISNGGKFTQRVACELPDRIAAIGVVSATGLQSVCNRCSGSRAIPVAFFLGSEDPLVPREGEHKELGKIGDALGLTDMGITSVSGSIGKMAGLMSAEEVVDFWTKFNGCSGTARNEVLPDRNPRDGCTVSKATFAQGRGGSEVLCYTIHGGGHTWPGGFPYAGPDVAGRTTLDINASELLWQFFQAHPLR